MMIIVGARALLLTLLATAAASQEPNEVDCAFRKLALQMASRNLEGNSAKMSIVAAGINASSCPGGDQWALRYSAQSPPLKQQISTRAVFVSPTGVDSNPGTVHAPVRTLLAAQGKVRKLLQIPGAVTVYLREGTYYESLVLGPADSGTANGPVTWRSYQGEAAAISGGDVLNCDWKPVTLQSGVLSYTCKLPQSQPTFESLFFNGERMQRARWPNGDATVPCNSPQNCKLAGYTQAAQATTSIGQCAPDSTAVRGQVAKIYNGATKLSQGILNRDAGAPDVVLNVTDTDFVHDAGAFTDFVAYEGGGVSCYNTSHNLPYWNAGTCNCKSFALQKDASDRISRWRKPESSAVVRMFHSSLWGGWAFNVTGFTPALQPSGWGSEEHCTSCQYQNRRLKDLGGGLTLAQCKSSCEDTPKCKFVNYAESSDGHCVLFATCDDPSHQSGCVGNQWWTTIGYNGTTAAASLSISGGQQTGQQGQQTISGNNFFVENVKEELDNPGEFFVDAGTLFVIPPVGTTAASLKAAHVVAASRARVLQLRGDGENYARNIVISGLTVMHSAPTFMSDYEIPSGGDWSVHRGGAIFLDGTEDIVIEHTAVDHAGGNGICLSNHAWRTNLLNNTIAYAGDSSIMLVGSTQLMNGTLPSYPAYTNITGCLSYENGYFGKQTAALFKSISYKTLVRGNVFFNSPRSIINYNDAFRGGDVLQANVIWGAVKETADHASFNSWDRQSWFWEQDGATHFRPETMTISNNLILNKDYQYGSANSDWSIDHDDASSWFEDFENVMVYGGHKWRDGVHKWYTNNLYVTPADASASQQWGIGWYTPNTKSSRFTNNTMITYGSQSQFHFTWSIPVPDADFVVGSNKYYTPGNDKLPFHVGNQDTVHTLKEWQQLTQNDLGSVISSDMDLPRIMAKAKELLGL